MNFEGVKIVHFIPGRVRLRIEKVKRVPQFADNIKQQLNPIPGIRNIDIKELTGSVLIEYDKQALTSQQSLDALTKALQNLFPAFDTKQITKWLSNASTK
jgi:hypothetical protein